MATSRFLRLPLEIRQHVYSSLYSSHSLTYPHLSRLPLASLSRQIREESQPAYYQNTRFNFRNTKHLVDYLTSIDSSTLRQLRYVSVKGHPFPVYLEKNFHSYETHFFHSVLQLFPDLQLATLTVREPYHEPESMCDWWGHETAYEDVERLIKSDGFKELVYTSASDQFMKVHPDQDEGDGNSHRDPQPSTWDKMIKDRDGADSGAGVEMFRVTKDGRIKLKDEFETVQDTSEAEKPDPIEVRVKRGKRANYVQSGQSTSEYDNGLHDLFNRLNWEEIKEQELYVEVTDEDPSAHL